MAAKIAVIGICGNSFFLQVDHFHKVGETVIANSMYEEIGGKGINQAVAASRMGAEVSFLAAIGDDLNADKCIKAAKENGLKASFSIKEGEDTTIAFILTDKEGENRVTGMHGAKLSVSDVEGFEIQIKEADILLLQQEVPVEVNERAIEIANKYDTKVILNPAPAREISSYIADHVFLIIPNEAEQEAVDIRRFKNCITTLGSKGCLINGETAIPSLNVKAVDTTGAGDTFNGVLATCIAEGMHLETAAKYAVSASGLSVAKKYVLNAIPYRDEIEAHVIMKEKPQ